MSHSHHHHHDTAKGLSFAFWLNLLFSIIEIIGGILTNSTAIMADAFHDFMDAGAIGLSVGLEKMAKRKRTPQFSYGYKRLSLLAALGMSLVLLIGAVIMLFGAVKTLINPKVVDSSGMLWLAVLGIAINGLAFIKLKKETHGHHHNSKAVMLHLLEDVLGWVAVLIGAAVIQVTGWYRIDGILALAIAGFIGFNVTKNLIETMRVLLQSVPETVNVNQFETDVMAIDGVKSIHDLHLWSLDGNYNVGSMHVVVNNRNANKPATELLALIVRCAAQHHIQHPTVQIETEESYCQLIGC